MPGWQEVVEELPLSLTPDCPSPAQNLRYLRRPEAMPMACGDAPGVQVAQPGGRKVVCDIQGQNLICESRGAPLRL